MSIVFMLLTRWNPKNLLNGSDEAPLYKYLKSQKEGRIKWNFTKFLIGSDGEVKARFEPTQKPEAIESAIARELR